jgi:hypothetical protein
MVLPALADGGSQLGHVTDHMSRIVTPWQRLGSRGNNISQNKKLSSGSMAHIPIFEWVEQLICIDTIVLNYLRLGLGDALGAAFGGLA